MDATNAGGMLLRGSEIAILSTILMGLVLYAFIRACRFGTSSVVRCLAGSFACSAVVLGSFALSAVLAFPCGPVATLFLLFGLLLGVVLTLPVQLAVFGLPAGQGVTVWIVYMVFTPLVVLWIIVLLEIVF